MRNAILGFTFGIAATAAFGLAGRDDAIEASFAEGYAKAQAQYRTIVQDTHTIYQAMPQECAEVITSMSAEQMLWHLEDLCDTTEGIEVSTHDYGYSY